MVQALNRLIAERGIPGSIRLDNGPEFTSRLLDHWAWCNGVTLDVIRPGTPTDNAVIEAFNARLRQECLNEHWFLSVADAQELVDTWREDYNRVRPHSSLGNMTPEEFVQQALEAHPHGGEHGTNGAASTTQRRRQEVCLTG